MSASTPDRTREAVRAQLAAMNAARYEIGVRDADGQLLPLTLTAGEIARRLGYFRAMNARGSDLYIRPAGSVGLVFVDDLTAAALARMRADGVAPAVVVESSPGNYQAWVRLAETALPPEVATAAARELADRYNGDPHAADWRHYGRLAGFTNRKPAHTRPDGRQPYVLLHDASGRLAPTSAQVLTRAQERLAEQQREKQGEEPAPQNRPAEARSGAQAASFSHRQGGAVSAPVEVDPPEAEGVSRLGQAYRREAARLLDRYPHARSQGQLHRLDYMIVLDLARTYPTATGRELQRAMAEGSPHIGERKAGHVEDYTRRTVRKAWAGLGREPEPWMGAEPVRDCDGRL